MASVTKKTSDQPIEPRGCTNFKLRQLTRLVSAHCEPYFSATGLKTTQYSLLAHIDFFGPAPPGELARRMGLDASTLTRNLQPLVASGLAETLPGGDARSRLVQLTEAGRQKRVAMKANWKRAQLSVNAKLGSERVQRLHRLLDECLELLKDDQPSSTTTGV